MADSWCLHNRATSVDNISVISCTTATDANMINLSSKGNTNGYTIGHSKGQTLPNCDNYTRNSREFENHPLEQQPQQHEEHEPEKENDNIIPWRAQLRKTNSRLSLI